MLQSTAHSSILNMLLRALLLYLRISHVVSSWDVDSYSLPSERHLLARQAGAYIAQYCPEDNGGTRQKCSECGGDTRFNGVCDNFMPSGLQSNCPRIGCGYYCRCVPDSSIVAPPATGQYVINVCPEQLGRPLKKCSDCGGDSKQRGYCNDIQPAGEQESTCRDNICGVYCECDDGSFTPPSISVPPAPARATSTGLLGTSLSSIRTTNLNKYSKKSVAPSSDTATLKRTGSTSMAFSSSTVKSKSRTYLIDGSTSLRTSSSKLKPSALNSYSSSATSVSARSRSTTLSPADPLPSGSISVSAASSPSSTLIKTPSRMDVPSSDSRLTVGTTWPSGPYATRSLSSGLASTSGGGSFQIIPVIPPLGFGAPPPGTPPQKQTCPANYQDTKCKDTSCQGKEGWCQVGQYTGCPCQEECGTKENKPKCAAENCLGEQKKCTIGPQKDCNCCTNDDTMPLCTEESCNGENGQCIEGDSEGCDCIRVCTETGQYEIDSTAWILEQQVLLTMMALSPGPTNWASFTYASSSPTSLTDSAESTRGSFAPTRERTLSTKTKNRPITSTKRPTSTSSGKPPLPPDLYYRVDVLQEYETVTPILVIGGASYELTHVQISAFDEILDMKIAGPLNFWGTGSSTLKGGIKGFNFTFEATDPDSKTDSRITFHYVGYTWSSDNLKKSDTDPYCFHNATEWSENSSRTGFQRKFSCPFPAVVSIHTE